MPSHPHPHAHNMLLYAQDAAETETPWERWEYSKLGIHWDDIYQAPLWEPKNFYRRKAITININGFDVPEPVREPLIKGDRYYIANIANDHFKYLWGNDDADYMWLKRGLIHRTKEAAELHIKALISFTKQGEIK